MRRCWGGWVGEAARRAGEEGGASRTTRKYHVPSRRGWQPVAAEPCGEWEGSQGAAGGRGRRRRGRRGGVRQQGGGGSRSRTRRALSHAEIRLCGMPAGDTCTVVGKIKSFLDTSGICDVWR